MTEIKKRYLLAEQTIDAHDREALIEWLRTDPWLTQGALVREFESRWADWLGTRHATFVNSGSSANLLAYYAMLISGRLRNRKVIVPAVSWATTVAPAIQLGFEPIVCEADASTFGLDLDHLEALLKEHDPALVVLVHVLGVPCAMEPLLALKEKYGFALIEDACAATGSRYDGRLVGTFADLSTFSFFYGHHMSTIEGGMVCTSDDALHELLLLTRSHGWAKDIDPGSEAARAQARGVQEFNRPFTFYVPGFNLRSTDLNARLGLLQMDKLESIIQRRAENHRVYQGRFRSTPPFHCQVNERAMISSISFVALAGSSDHRDRIAALLKEEGIETRPLGGGNMSRQPFWADRLPSRELVVADRIAATSFQLPNHPRLSVDDVAHICDVVLSVPV